PTLFFLSALSFVIAAPINDGLIGGNLQFAVRHNVFSSFRHDGRLTDLFFDYRIQREASPPTQGWRRGASPAAY
ncbi:hypothetical protein BJ912DRAFT_939500, partial [Pholiota molesta]